MNRKRSENRSKSRFEENRNSSPIFDVEQMEQRLLLSANLYEPSTPPEGVDRIQEKLSSQLKSTFDELGNLGDSLNTTYNNKYADTLVPLVDKTLDDVIGNDIGNFFKFAAGDQGIADILDGENPDSGKLGLGIQTAINSFGLSGTVVDESSAFGLDLLVNINHDPPLEATEIRLGNVEEELNVRIEEGTEVNVDSSRDLSFRIRADLSALQSTDPVADKLNNLGDDKFWIDLFGDEGLSVGANVLHTSTTDPLSTFGVQIGLLGMQEDSNGAGAFALSGSDFRLDVSGEFSFSDINQDSRLDLGEMKNLQSGGNWDTVHDFSTPTTDNQNSAEFQIQVAVNNDPNSDTHIGGIIGVTGALTFSDNDLFDGNAPMSTSDETLASFSRLTSQDILNMAGGVSGWASALQASGIYGEDVPFLDINTGNAYAFGQAFQNVFLAQLQNVEQVLTARNAPSTWTNSSGSLVRNPLDYSGSSEFLISVNGASWATISLPENAGRTSLEALASELSNRLPSGVEARVTQTNSPRLEIFSSDRDTQFVLAGFSDASAGTLDLGFDALQQLVLANDSSQAFGGSLLEDSQLQTSGIIFEPTAAVDLADFQGTPKVLEVSINGDAPISVTIPAFAYSDFDVFATRLRELFGDAGLLGSTDNTGVFVETFISEDGRNGLRFHGGSNVHSLQFGGNAATELNLSTTVQDSQYFDLTVDGDTTETYRVFLPGNLTTGILGSAANTTINDFVDDLRFSMEHNAYLVAGASLSKKRLLDDDAGTGIDVRGSLNDSNNRASVQFFARNPGQADGEISSFSLNASGFIRDLVGFTQGTADALAGGDIRITPNFDSVQEFAARIANSPVDLSGSAGPSWDTNTLTFTFPVSFDYAPPALNDDPSTTDEDERVAVDLGTDYDHVSNLKTDSRVEVTRLSESDFDFQFSLRPLSRSVEELSVEIPVMVYDWDGKLDNDAVFTILLDDGNEHDLIVTAETAATNLEIQDFVDQLNDALEANAAISDKVSISLGLEEGTSTPLLRFTTVTSETDSRILQVLIRPEVASAVETVNAAVDRLGFAAGKTDFTSIDSQLIASSIPTSYTLTRDAIFEVSLFDGNRGLIYLEASETSDNTDLSDLVDDINFAIEQSGPLSTVYDGTKVEAFAGENGLLGFRLNEAIYPAGGTYPSEAWSIEVFPNYRQPSPNGASLQLSLPEKNTDSAGRNVPVTALSGSLSGDDPFRLLSEATLLVSINGSGYASVAIPPGDLGATLGDLIADVNTALEGSTVEVNNTSRALSSFVKAAMNQRGDGFAIQSLDLVGTGNPEVMTMRVRADSGIVDNAATTQLGFAAEEQRAGWRGGQAYLDNVSLTGSASVTDQPVTATATFGFAEFAAEDGTLNLTAASTTLLRDGIKTRFSLYDLNDLVSSDSMDTVAVTTVDGTTFATLVLDDLSFTGASVEGLQFGDGATITISHALTSESSSSSITDFSVLPNSEVTYQNTRGMENLSNLLFDDVFQGLLRSAEFISDQMRIDPDGSDAAVNPYETSLLFIRESLVGQFDFGYEFETMVAQMADAPPATLQNLQQTLADSLQVGLSEVDVRLAADYDTASEMTGASVEISLPFVKTFAVSLPLFIDLAQLRNRSSDPAIVKTYLAGLDALASTLSNPLNVDLSVLSDLDLDLGIQVVDQGVQQTPRAILHETTTIDSHFNLAGGGLNGDLPVGNARFRLTDGQVAINATGEASVNDQFNTEKRYNELALIPGYSPPSGVSVTAATTVDLGGVYNATAGTLTASANGPLVIDGIDVAVGNLILVNNQEDDSYVESDSSWTVTESDKAQNGVYRVTAAGSDSSLWSLVRDDTANETAQLNDLHVKVTNGEHYAGRDFVQTVQIANVGTDTKSFAKLIDPAALSINLNQDFNLPFAVVAATTSQLGAVYSNGTGNPGNPAFGARLTAVESGSLNGITTTLASGRVVAGIDGVTLFEVGDLVLVKDQVSSDTEADTRYQNGVYRIVDLGAAGSEGSPWVLERVEFADEASEMIELRVAAQLGRDNGRTAFVQDNPNLGSISAGQVISFNDSLNRVYAEFNTSTLATDAVATVSPEGQAQAYLPMVIVVTGEDGVERIISKDTSQLSPEEANDPAFMATQPDFDPVNIRVVSEGERSGLDRFFDLTVPSNEPGVPAPVVFFSNPQQPQDELNPFYLNIPPVDVLQVLRDPFIMAESLDLALFNLQFAIDQALGNELPLLGLNLPTYTIFLESWRSDFTNSLRDKLRNNKLKPINATIDALFEALGPGGAGYLTARDQIGIETLDASETATVWNPNDSNNYDLTPANEEFEVTPGSAVSLQFSLDLVKTMDGDDTEVNIEQIIMPDEIGFEIDTATQSLDSELNPVDTTGGVNLRTSFTLHFGFGVDLNDGFYLYNPVDDGVGESESLMSIGVQAVLDGDINKSGVQEFSQGKRTSKLHLLDVQVADALTVPGGVVPTDSAVGSQGASGVYSTYEFYLNTGSGGNDLNRTTIPDIQARNTLGIDPTVTIPGVTLSNLDYGVISFDTNGDSDINLLVEGGKPGDAFGGDGGIPDIQTEFYFQARYGEGSDRLSYVTQAVYDAAKEAVENGNATDAQKTLADQPDYRHIRSLIDGAVYDYTNVTVDAEEFLRGTIFEMLLKFSEGFAPIRPVFDFLLKPVPGTEWMADPFIIGELLGSKFLIFARSLTYIDGIIKQMGEGLGLAEGKPSWAKPRVSLVKNGPLNIKALGALRVVGGAARSVGFSTNLGKVSPLDKQRDRIEKYIVKRDDNAYQKKLDRAERKFKSLQEPTSDRKASQSLRQAFQDKVNTPNKFSKKFEKFRDKGFAKSEGSGLRTKFVNKVKESANRGLVGNDDRGGRKSPIIGISGGGFRLDYLKVENIQKILLGQPANLSYLELPNIELGIAYDRSFPLPAFPPLQLTVGANFSIRTHLKFGWDTQGFYWSTLDLKGKPSPAFGVTVGFNVGVALNFGLIEAGVEAFFKLDLDFNWNDVTVPSGTTTESAFLGGDITVSNPNAIGYGKLRGSQVDFLKSLPGGTDNLFDITLTGTIGLTFYVDLTIPIPFVGPIVKRILAKTFSLELFKVTFYAEKPGIQLGAVSGNKLTLHMGDQFANLRVFGDTTARNEVFTLESEGLGSTTGEKIKVKAVLQGQEHSQVFDNVTEVIGYAGGGQSVIDASDLLYAVVDFTGGSGNSILKASAAAGSILRGGSGTSTLTGAANARNTLIGGQGNTTIYGGTAADTIRSGERSDVLAGGGGGDTYEFSDQFGRDRLFAVGSGNTVDFSNATEDVTFNLGRLVQSAKQGNNTIFFAPDSAGENSIDNWIAGSGDDRFNTFYFAPNTTLDLQGGLGDNFYSITLGNQFKRFFSDVNPSAPTLLERMDRRNIGYINITDAGGRGHTLIKQSFPERISYNITEINNGREQVAMAGISRVDLDAGDATVVWGDPSKQWIDLGVGANVTAGTVEMQSNVEAEGLTLNLKRSFSVTRALNLRNDSDVTITIQNPDPLASANLFLGSNRPATDSWLPGIYSSSGSVFTSPGVDPGAVAPGGNGTGLVRIEVPTGGVIDGSDAASIAGTIMARNGEVVIEARDTVGYASNPVSINARYFAASTTKVVSTDAEGINIISGEDLHFTLVDGVNGLSTVSGRIELTLAAGKTLYYGNATAGSGRDIIFNADKVEQSGGRQYEVLRNVLSPFDVSYTVTHYVEVTKRHYWPFHGWLFGWDWYTTYTVLEPRTYTVTYQVYRLVEELVTETLPAGGSISTEGDVYFRNTTDNQGIQVGGSAGSTDTLNVTSAILDTISDGARTIIIGRNGDETIRSGRVQIANQAFSQGIIVKASEIDLLEAISSASKIELEAYESNGVGAGDGSIHFNASISPVSAPTLLATAFRDIRVDADLQSSAINGLVQLTAGSGVSKYGADDSSGSIFVGNGSSISAANTGGALILKAGLNNGDLDLLGGSVSADSSISVQAQAGAIRMDSGSQLETKNLEAIAGSSTLLRTNVETITNAKVFAGGATSGKDLSIVEFDSLTLNRAITEAGNIDIVTGGELVVGEIDAGSDFAVTVTAGGAIEGLDLLAGVNLNAQSLNASANGDIDLSTTLDTLTAASTGAGNVKIDDRSGEGSVLQVDSISTVDGYVLVDSQGHLLVDSIVSSTSNSQNTITLRTQNSFGGNITVDQIDAGAAGSVQFESGTVSPLSASESGGMVRSKSNASERVTAADLTVIAGGFADDPETRVIDLRTDVADLIARALSAGDPDKVNSRADIVIDEENDIRLRWLSTQDGDISVTSGGDIVHQSVSSPNRDITFDAAGSVTVQLDEALNDGVVDLPAKLRGRNLHVVAHDEIEINTTVDQMIVESRTLGDVTITESDSVLFERIKTAEGDITLTSGEFDQVNNAITKGGSAILGVIQAGNNGTDKVELNAYGQARTSGQVDPSGNLLPGDTVVVDAKITAGLLEVASYGRLDLLTNIDRLVADNFSIGNVNITEQSGIIVEHLTSSAGSITLTSDGSIDAYFIESKDDIDQAETFDVNLRATSGDVSIDTVTVGGLYNDVHIKADLGSIEEMAPGDSDDSFEGSAAGGLDITADHAVLEAHGSIGGIRPLETKLNSLKAVSASQGDIDLNEHDAITLTDVDTNDGSITLDAGGSITALNVESKTDQDDNDIRLHTTSGDILVDRIDAGSAQGDVFLDADQGKVEEHASGDAGIDITSDNAKINAHTSIGGEQDLETEINTLEAHAGTIGDIDLNELDAITLTDVDTNDGSITLDAGGSITALNVESKTDQDDNDIRLHTTSGDILVDRIDAGSAQGDVFLDADQGKVEEHASGDAGIDITSDNAKINAHTSIGGEQDLETEINTLEAHAGTIGDIDLNELDAITLTDVDTNDGSITLDAGGSITALNVESKTDQDDNDIRLHTTSGDILVDRIDAGSAQGDVFLDADQGKVEEHASGDAGIDITSDNAKINAHTSIGGEQDLETEINTLEAHAGTIGDIDLNELDAITLTDVDTNDGSITLDAGGSITALNVESKTDQDDNDIRLHTTSGDILVDRIDAGSAQGDVFLDADQGKVEEHASGDAGIDITSDNAKINAHTSIGGEQDLETEINTLEAHAGTIGDIDLNELDAITLTDVDTNDGSITLDAGGSITALNVESKTDQDDNDIRLHTTSGDILVDRIDAGSAQGDVFLDADQGKVEEHASGDAGIDITSDNAKINAHTSIGGEQDLETEINTLEAHAGTIGDIDLNELDAITLTDVDTNDGSITLDAGGSITALNVESKTDQDDNDIRLHTTSGDILVDRIDAGSAQGDVFLDADQGKVEEHASGDAGIDITSDNAKINAHTSIGGEQDLETEINTLEAHAGTIGDIDLNELDAITLTDVDTNDGSITLDAGGSITALNVESKTDQDDNDIRLHTTSGDILVDRIDAGNVAGDMILTSDSGNIDELSAEDTEIDVIADHAVLNAYLGVGGVSPLETQFNSLQSESYHLGNIDLNELDAIVLNSVVSKDGAIEIDAGGNITARLVESLSDDDSNDITLHNTAGDILIDKVFAQRDSSDLFITSDTGRVDSLQPEDLEVDLQGDHAVIYAFGSIGGFQTLDTELNSIEAEVTDAGDIDLHEATSFTVNRASTSNGSIKLLIDEDGSIDLLTTGRDQSGNDVDIVAGGTLNVNRILSGYDSFASFNPASSTTITLVADRILEWQTDSNVDLRAANLNVTSNHEIGALSDPIETSARRIDSKSDNGDNALNNYATGAVTVTKFSSIVGSLFFEQFGAEITLNSVNTGLGNIALFHNGSENMIIDDLVAGDGDVQLTVRDAGRLQIYNTDVNGDASMQADELDFLGAWKSISGTGTLSVQTNNPSNGILVSPYKASLDRVRILEYDIARDRRNDFNLTFFNGNALFDLPPTNLSSGGDVGSSKTGAESPGSEFAFVSVVMDNSNPAAEEERSSFGSRQDQPAQNIGVSLGTLSSFPLAFSDFMSSSLFKSSGFDDYFNAYFGFQPLGLESLLPDLFDELTERLSEEELEDELELEESTRDDQLVVSRGEAPELEIDWESTRDSGQFQETLVPLVLAGAVGRLKNRFFKSDEVDTI